MVWEKCACAIDEGDSQKPYRGRNIEELTKRVGDIRPLIEQRATEGKPVRVLEVGCGYGVVLSELKKQYGNSIELHCVNKVPKHGDDEKVRRTAVEEGIITEDEAKDFKPAEIKFHDVEEGLPFEKGSFDVIFSQVSFIHFSQKAKVIEEIHRLLRENGIARLDLSVTRDNLAPEYQNTFQIEENDKPISFWDYSARFSQLSNSTTAEGRRFLEVRKTNADETLDLKLDLVETVNLNTIDPELHGKNSKYKVRT